jgi:hypothetical protein
MRLRLGRQDKSPQASFLKVALPFPQSLRRWVRRWVRHRLRPPRPPTLRRSPRRRLHLRRLPRICARQGSGPRCPGSAEARGRQHRRPIATHTLHRPRRCQGSRAPRRRACVSVAVLRGRLSMPDLSRAGSRRGPSVEGHMVSTGFPLQSLISLIIAHPSLEVRGRAPQRDHRPH